MSDRGSVEPATPGFVTGAPRLGFVGGFDGIRGLFMLFVLAQHASNRWTLDAERGTFFPSVAAGIDVFFALSAFLIVTLLMQEYRDRGRLDLRKFYARRGIRLLPSAWDPKEPRATPSPRKP